MKFFKTLIAATIGTLLAMVILFFVLVFAAISTGGEPEPYVRDNSVLKMNISGTLPARQNIDPIEELLDLAPVNTISLVTLKENLRKAAADESIKGVLLEIDFVGEGWANLQEAHRTITQFRDSTDKFIYATTNDIGYNEKGYYLATATDSVFSPPESFFEFDGFYSQVTFYDGLFEKVGVQTEITRSGEYKGAVEPYIRKELSEANEYQLTQILNDVSSEFVNAAAQKTGRTADDLNNLLNEMPRLTASFGYEEGLIDSLLYTNQLDSLINKRIGLTNGESYKSIDGNRYAKVSNASAGVETPDSEGKIAVIYASGPILPGLGNSPFGEQLITAPWFKEQLEAATEDDDVQALVVRINSPGGSGSTSDAIWNMLQETKTEMPVIVSMGPVAASGGYYIAMAADSIIAEPTTITGSIGVFATKFNTKQLFNEQLGITFDQVKSHQHADWLLPTQSFTESEQQAFQSYVDKFYDTFISKVAQSRGLTKQQVDDVAQGRVWTGADAKEENLVDVLGGMDTALSIAAEKAGLQAYETESFPKSKDLYQLLMGAAQTKVKSMVAGTFLESKEMNQLQRQVSIMKKRDAMLLFPYDLVIE